MILEMNVRKQNLSRKAEMPNIPSSSLGQTVRIQLAITLSRFASMHRQPTAGASLNKGLLSVQPNRLTWFSRLPTQAF